MEWRDENGNYVAIVARRDGGYYTHRLPRAKEVSTQNGELTVIYVDDEGTEHVMTFAAGTWLTLELLQLVY